MSILNPQPAHTNITPTPPPSPGPQYSSTQQAQNPSVFVLGSNTDNEYLKERKIDEKARQILAKLEASVKQLIKPLKIGDTAKEKMLEDIASGYFAVKIRRDPLNLFETEKLSEQAIKPIHMTLSLKNVQIENPVRVTAYNGNDVAYNMLRAGIEQKEKMLEEISAEFDKQISEQVAKMAVIPLYPYYFNNYSNSITASGSTGNTYIDTTSSTSMTSMPVMTMQNSTWYTNISDIIREQLNKVSVREGSPTEIELPDGTILNVDSDGNFTINDSNAKTIYKSMRMKEGNEFINATDLIERFIVALGKQGVKQSELLHIPIEVFFTWLVVEAAKQDGDNMPDMDVMQQLRAHNVSMLSAPKKDETQLDMFDSLMITVLKQPEKMEIAA